MGSLAADAEESRSCSPKNSHNIGNGLSGRMGRQTVLTGPFAEVQIRSDRKNELPRG